MRQILKTNMTNKAQALVELAVFGSVLLFCFGILIRYGLMMNYQQRVQMEAFRRAVIKAHEGKGENGYHNASYTLLKDKNIPNPLNMLAQGEHSPVASTANVILTNSLFITKDGIPQEAPRMFITINDKPYVFKIAVPKEYTPVKSNNDDIHDPGEIWVKVQNPDWAQNGGQKYNWKELSYFWLGYEYGTLEQASKKKPYRKNWNDAIDLDADGEKDSVKQADLDGDGEEESIIYVEGFCSSVDNGNGIYIQKECAIYKFKVWDYNDPDVDVDTTIASKYANEAFGLRPGFTKEDTNQSSLEKNENNAQIINKREPNFTENIVRGIRVNPHAIQMDMDNDGVIDEVVPVEIETIQLKNKDGIIENKKVGVIKDESVFKRNKSTIWTTQK